jgi:DNA repair protein RecN (Recombination protein N)
MIWCGPTGTHGDSLLSVLRISGFALIDELELELGPGLTVITGETGAGKSIIVEALGLLRGGRSSAELIRAGRDEARVEAIIELPAAAEAELRARMEAEGRDGPGEGGLLVRRTVARSGRGRVHLAGGLATAGDLAVTVAGLIDIASQHDQQSLTDAESQMAILDAFAENETLRAEMTSAHRALTATTAALESFNADARTRAEREDLLKFQLAELEAAALEGPGEDDQLRVERERLKGAEKFFGAASRGEETLYAQEGAVVGQIGAVVRELGSLSALDPALAPLVERLVGAQATVEDVARDLGRYASRIRSDPARLNEVEERLFLLGRLCRKHGGTLAEVIERRETIARDLGEMGSFEAGLAERRAAQAQAEAAARAAADALSRSRRKAASGLEKKVTETLRELGLSHASLPVLVEPRAGAVGAAAHGPVLPGASGADRVRFLFAPNVGEEPRPLARIASGGELSRVMLAVKQALAKTDRVLTYIFDEVDSGIGGGIAETIGRKLKKIAASRQVIAITHLPQIAVFADAHIRVSKTSGQGRTRVAVEGVSGKERTREIARMLGGATPSAEATAHADEMLRRAASP